jgi:hypothetical protein
VESSRWQSPADQWEIASPQKDAARNDRFLHPEWSTLRRKKTRLAMTGSYILSGARFAAKRRGSQ